MNSDEIKRIAVVGAGTVGSGTAELFAEAGFAVIWHNRSNRTAGPTRYSRPTPAEDMRCQQVVRPAACRGAAPAGTGPSPVNLQFGATVSPCSCGTFDESSGD